MSVFLSVAVVLVAYLLGSLSFAYIITKVLTGEDIRTKGSGNAGFTNAMRVLPKKWAVIVFVLDVLKGMVAVILGRILLGDNGALMAIVFVVLGHMFPFWMGFRGGKGIATGLGSILVYDWRMAVIMLGIWAVVTLLSNHVSAGSVVAAFSLAVTGICYHPHLVNILIFVFLSALVIYKHRANIERLISGTESKIFKNRKWSLFERRYQK